MACEVEKAHDLGSLDATCLSNNPFKIEWVVLPPIHVAHEMQPHNPEYAFCQYCQNDAHWRVFATINVLNTTKAAPWREYVIRITICRPRTC